MDGMHSPWFSDEVRPVRAGVYQRDYGDQDGPPELCFCYWDGESWFAQNETPYHAVREECPSIVPAPWRGLTLEEYTMRNRDASRARERMIADAKP